MSKTFDFETAWDELAWPGWEALPANMRQLAEDTAAALDGVGQLPNLAMPWPDDEGEIKRRMGEIPAEWLAQASKVVYVLGHWAYTGSKAPAFCKSGGHWKFSNLADQELSARLGMRSPQEREGNGISFRVHEGAIRLQYSSPDAWTWREVAPATWGGLEYAKGLGEQLRVALPHRDPKLRSTRAENDNAAWQWFESSCAPAPEIAEWNTARYMVEEDVSKARKAAARAENPDQRAATLAKLQATYDHKVAELGAELARMRRLVELGIDLDNAIYYAHKDLICFGWREPVSHEETSRLEDLLCEFPYAYEIKSASRGTVGTRAS